MANRADRRSPDRRRRIEDAIAGAKAARSAGTTVFVVFPSDLTTKEHEWVERELGDVNWVGGRIR